MPLPAWFAAKANRTRMVTDAELRHLVQCAERNALERLARELLGGDDDEHARCLAASASADEAAQSWVIASTYGGRPTGWGWRAPHVDVHLSRDGGCSDSESRAWLVRVATPCGLLLSLSTLDRRLSEDAAKRVALTLLDEVKGRG